MQKFRRMRLAASLLSVVLFLALLVAPALASNANVQDTGKLFESAQSSSLQRFANAMSVPVTIYTQTDWQGSKQAFTDFANNLLQNRSGVAIAITSSPGPRYRVVVQRGSNLSSNDLTNATSAGDDFLRVNQYAPAVYKMLYSLDESLGGQAARSLNAGPGPSIPGGVYENPSGSTSSGSGGSGGGIGSTGSSGSSGGPVTTTGGGGGFDFTFCLCGIMILIVGIAIFSSVFRNNRRVQQRSGNWGGYGGGGGGGGFFGGGGGFFGGGPPIIINNSGNSYGGNDRGGQSNQSNQRGPDDITGDIFSNRGGGNSGGGGGVDLGSIFGGSGDSGSGGFSGGSSFDAPSGGGGSSGGSSSGSSGGSSGNDF